MKRTTPLKRTPFRTKAKRKKRAVPLVAKKLGKSAVSKGPARDPEHLARVRAHGCLFCRKVPAEAHHVRCIAPRSMGKRVSDYLTVPLCKFHHDTIHAGREEVMWALVGGYAEVSPVAFIRRFSEEGRKAIESLSNPLTQGRNR